MYACFVSLYSNRAEPKLIPTILEPLQLFM